MTGTSDKYNTAEITAEGHQGYQIIRAEHPEPPPPRRVERQATNTGGRHH